MTSSWTEYPHIWYNSPRKQDWYITIIILNGDPICISTNTLDSVWQILTYCLTCTEVLLKWRLFHHNKAIASESNQLHLHWCSFDYCVHYSVYLAYPAAVAIRSIRPDSEVHGANTGPTWVLSAPDGAHVGPTNLAVRACETHLKHKSLHSSDIALSYAQFLNELTNEQFVICYRPATVHEIRF